MHRDRQLQHSQTDISSCASRSFESALFLVLTFALPRKPACPTFLAPLAIPSDPELASIRTDLLREEPRFPSGLARDEILLGGPVGAKEGVSRAAHLVLRYPDGWKEDPSPHVLGCA